MLKLPGYKSLTGKVLNKQHLQLLCPKELNGFVSSAPQGGIQQGRGEDIPCACWWWSPGRERGGKGSLSSLRTSETQFSKVSHEHDLTETLAGTGKALILGESKGNIFKRVYFLQRTPDCIVCDLQLKPAKLEVLPWIRNDHGCVSLHFCLWIPVISVSVRNITVFPSSTLKRTAQNADSFSSCSIEAVRIQGCVLKQLPKHSWYFSYSWTFQWNMV